MTRMPETDEELLEMMKVGDRTSFDAIFAKYWEPVYTTAFSFSSDPEVSMEITHDIFVNLWAKREILQINSLKGYLNASARYHIWRYLRSAKRSRLVYSDDLTILGGITESEVESRMGASELKRRIEWHIGKLPKRCKEIFTLSRIDHLSNEEIATKLDISKRTVENQISTALHHLRISLRNIPFLTQIALFGLAGAPNLLQVFTLFNGF